jgi:dTDP-4-dehydrorhamnose 3,5-epimerase
MKVTRTPFEGLLIVEPVVHGDARGYFFESYSHRTYAEAGIPDVFVQDNQSRSRQGVVRGLHFQIPPHGQTKLVRALQGSIRDVVVDLRRGQPTYGRSFSLDLSSENQKQLLIPKGFAHGFSVLSPWAEILYKCDAYYSPAHDKGIQMTDPSLGIDWGLGSLPTIVSEKDKALPLLSEIPVYFD